MVAQSPDQRTHDHAAESVPEAALPRPAAGLSTSRRSLGFGLAPVGIPVLTAGLLVRRDEIGLDSVLLLHLLAVVIVAVTGGLGPALLAALVSFPLANWFLTPPSCAFEVQGRQSLIELGLYEKMFRPFQRFGDRDNSTGVGLGPAIARGFSDAMHVMLAPFHIPGGLTMTLTLPVST